MERIAETSPRFKARMAGVCQLMEAVTAALGQVIIPGKLVVAGNAAATAANILGHERLFWLGFVLSLIGVAFHIAWALLMYELLKGGSSLSAFTPEQLQALALVFVRLNDYAFQIYLVFFGAWCLLIGYLIFRSTFLPRVLGVLLAISGLGWVTYLYPPLAHRVYAFIAAASALGEIPLELWLIVMGVNVQRWKEQASAAGEWRS